MTAGERRAGHVLFTVANVERDLEGLVLVSHFLSDLYGISSTFCRRAGLAEALLEQAPDAVVLDRLMSGDRVAHRASRLGTMVLVLPTAGFFQDAAAELARAVYPSGGVVHRFLAWGTHAAALLERDGGWPPDRVRITGCPRFDLYHPRYQGLTGGRAALLERLGVPADRPLIVWTTNTYFEEQRAADALPGGRALDPVAARQLADARVQYESISEAVLAMSERHPEWTFLIRVHPSELREPYEALARPRANLVVSGPARIQELLVHCDALVQAFSTTATEAFLCGKPVIEVAWGNYANAVRGEYLAGCDVCGDVGDVEAALQRAVRGLESDPGRLRARAELIRALYHAPDGGAAERCAAAIAELVLDPARTPSVRAALRERARLEHAAWRHARTARPAARLKALLGIDAERSLRFWRSGADPAVESRWRDPVQAQEVERLRAAFAVAARGEP
jgi:surface carbohydrate biosynthesis protein